MQLKKISSAEAAWMFKVAEQDHSLRSCDGVPKIFQTILSDDDIAKGFTMSRQKVSYVPLDGLGLVLGKRLCSDTGSSEGTFTVIFDEITTVQNKKQMHVLIPYWNKSEWLIVTQCLMSFFFHTTGEYIFDLFLQLKEDHNKQKFTILWDALPICHLMAPILTVRYGGCWIPS